MNVDRRTKIGRAMIKARMDAGRDILTNEYRALDGRLELWNEHPQWSNTDANLYGDVYCSEYQAAWDAYAASRP